MSRKRKRDPIRTGWRVSNPAAWETTRAEILERERQIEEGRRRAKQEEQCPSKVN